jgi:hypothetical protein
MKYSAFKLLFQLLEDENVVWVQTTRYHAALQFILGAPHMLHHTKIYV